MTTNQRSTEKFRQRSTEKLRQRSIRMTCDFLEIITNGRREDYEYSEAHRNRMREILKNPAIFSEDDKINTLLSFHKDTCANVMLQLYPSFGDEKAIEDLKILEEFETVLVGLDNGNRRIYLDASYKQLRAKIRLLQMKIEISDFLKSPDTLPEHIKNWMLRNLPSDDDDVKRLHGFKRENRNTLAKLQSLGVDISQYHDSDQYPKFLHDLPTQATIDQYMLLEKDVTRTSDKMVRLMEDGQPILVYLDNVRRHTEIMKRDLTTGS